MAKSILTLDEINLLKNSDEIKNKDIYGNLNEILQSIDAKKAISIEQLSSLDNKAIASLTYNKKTLIDTVIKEWYAERVSKEDPSKKVRCGLCNTPNKYLYYIRNRKNNKLLNVGSHCITKFPGIDGYIEQKNQLKQIERNQKIAKRRMEFYEKFSNPIEIIDNADEYFSKLPILLPYNLYYDMKETITRMRLIYSHYVNAGKKPFASTMDSFELFQLAIQHFETIKEQADKHVLDNRYKKFICERTEIDWMINTNKLQLLDRIATNNGFYTKDTMANMYSYSFIAKNYILLEKRNHSLVFKYSKTNSNSFTVEFTKKGYSPYITFSLSFENVAKKILPNCIFREDYYYESQDLIPYLKIDNTYNNIISIINYTMDIMININYVFLYDETVSSLILYRIVDGAIRTFSILNFLQAYSRYITKSDSFIKKYLISLIKGNKNTKWSDTIQQQKHGVYEKVSSLYYQQYIDTDTYNPKHSSSGDMFIEIPIYNCECDSDRIIVNFDNPQFFKIEKKILSLSYKQYHLIDYGIKINDKSFAPIFDDSDIILIHKTKKLNNSGIGLFQIENKLYIKKYCSCADKNENLIKIISLINKQDSILLNKNGIKVKGKILCRISNKNIT